MTTPLQAASPQAINTRAAWRPVLRPFSFVLIAAQLALCLQPLSVLAQDAGHTPYNPAAQAQLQRMAGWQQDVERAKLAKAQNQDGAGARVGRGLARAHELVRALQTEAAQGSAAVPAAAPTPASAPGKRRAFTKTAAQRDADYLALRTSLEAVEDDADGALEEFDAIRRELLAKRVPADILQRHDQAFAAMRERAQTLRQHARAFRQNQGAGELARLADYFDQFPATRKPQRLEAGKLPWRTPTPSTRMPAETKAAWHQNLHRDQHVRLAQAGNVGPIQFNLLPEPAFAPNAADLAPTDEVVLTPAIRAKAAELGNNPVAIYNWVRNHIDFAPTSGAIQSAQDTLDKMRGNATDTASLLIALLRAANIPARYQWGTIDLPAARVMNWVGGVTKPEAALQILNQGGIAARGITSGGQFTTIRMEHVWVQAYVNWTPSRGNRQGGNTTHPKVATPDGLPQHVNPNGPLNFWVPLDASFKQFNYTAGMDLKAQVPLDANALLTAAQQGASVNQAEGWVQNLNQANIQNQLNAYQSRLKAYIDSTATGANSTVGDVIGKKIIPAFAPQMLAGALPYPIVQQAAQASAVPSNWQHKFTYRLYASAQDKADDNPLLSFTEKTSQLVGKRLTLSYVPADQATSDLIASFLPKPHADGSPILPSELPTSLPGYLIRLKAQINLDGQVVASANQALTMGTDLYSTGGFTQLYDASQWDLTSEETNVVGQATAIGISAGGISASQLDALKDRLTATQGKLQASGVSGLSGEQISGDLLSAVIWSWFAAAESHNRLSQNQAGIIETPGLSYGLFHAVANPISSWGVVRKVTFPGVNMDIGHVRNLTWAKDNDAALWVGYNRLRGQYMSALEAAVPERFFNDPAQCNSQGASPIPALPDCPQGISAVKAIAIAAGAGQRIYTITQAVYAGNPGIVETKLSAHSQSTKDRVQQALEAGYEVTIHARPVAQGKWLGSGFAVIDTLTGEGGYVIEGGANGGYMDTAVAFGLAVLAGVLLFVSVAAVVASILLAVLVAPLWASLLTGAIGALTGLGANAAGADPVMAAAIRFTVGALFVFGMLAFGPASLVAGVALKLLLGFFARQIALEFALFSTLSQ